MLSIPLFGCLAKSSILLLYPSLGMPTQYCLFVTSRLRKAAKLSDNSSEYPRAATQCS
jgi:hypothetical protein